MGLLLDLFSLFKRLRFHVRVLFIFELDSSVTDGVFAEVVDGVALAFVCLQFGKEVADALHGQNALQINLRVELLSG